MAGPSVMVRLLGDLTGLGKSFDETTSKGVGAGQRLHSAFSGGLDTLNKTGVLGPFGDALAAADSGISKISGHAKEIGPVMMGVGATVAGLGVALQTMGSKDQAAHQQLQAAVEATGHSYDQYSEQVEATIKSQEKFGTTADVTQDALRTLTQATGDPTKALDMMGTAANLAAAKHESLSTASGQLAKAVNGSAKILKEFGITTHDTSGHLKTQSEIMTELSAKLSGQASAGAATFTGHMKALKAEVEDHVSLFAQKYGPAITGVGAAMTGVGAAIEVAKAATAAMKDGEVAATIAKNASAAAQWALNAAILANPVMIIVVALVALVAVVILAYTHCQTFRNIVDDMGRIAQAAFGVVVNGAQAAFGFISSHWPLLLAILTGPFGLAVYEIATHFDAIVGFAKKIPGDIEHALGDVGNLLVHAGEEIIGGLGRGIEHALTGVLDDVKGIGGKIASLKGPLDYDRQLLVPAGAAIMAGLHDSLAAGVSDVERLMGGVAPNISASFSPAAGGAAAIGGRSGPAVVIQDAHFSDDVDVDSFMRRVSWAVGTSRL